MEKQDQIISFIKEEQILDEETLQTIIEQQQKTGQSLINIIKKEHLLNEGELVRIVASANKIEFVNLSPEMVEPMVAHLLSSETANKYNVIPIRKEDNHLLVAMSSPLNLFVRDQVEMKTGYSVIPIAATPNAIRQAINYHFNVKNVTQQAIVSMRLQQEANKKTKGTGDGFLENMLIEAEKAKIASAPITKLVSSIIDGAIDSQASDIHIEPQEPDMRIRYRIDGILHDTIKIPSSAQLEVISRIKLKSEMDISERRAPQDGHMTVERNGKDYDLRVSSLPALGGEKIVIRILDKNVERWSLDSIVSSPEDNKKFKDLATNPYGMILLTGPTGSGKTTTLYSMLQMLNTPERNIVTVEDPIEYRLEGITQLQIKPIAGITFASALRSIVRQDPDIILVGEIRDTETAEIAISAALTGHLVLSTLHTNDAAGAISRLINLGIPPFLVASALLGTVAQRLMRVSCTKCKETYQASEEELKYLSVDESYHDRQIELSRGTGCNSCYQTGYHGRKSIYEIISISREINKLIIEQPGDEAIKQQALKEGMRTLYQNAINEVINGSTTSEELLRVVDVRLH